MDIISIIGLAAGIFTIVGGQILEGGHMGSLMQPTAAMIVIGGTMGAIMLQSSMRTFISGLKMARWLIFPPSVNTQQLITQIIEWSQIARKEGLLALEAQTEQISDPFQRKGIQLLVDGVEPQQLREVLEVEIGVYEEDLKLAAKIWESAGGFSPTIGIIGAVMGLIHVMENLSDPSKLGGGIAVAFVATIYGVALANMVCLPAAKKLLSNVSRLVTYREMFVDGLLGIANGDNPRIIETRLQGYICV